MEFETIYAAILAAAPPISSIIGIIVAVIMMKSNQDSKLNEVMETFELLRTEVQSSKEYEELKAQLLVSHQENQQLRRKLNELLTKIDHVRRSDDEK